MGHAQRGADDTFDSGQMTLHYWVLRRRSTRCSAASPYLLQGC